MAIPKRKMGRLLKIGVVVVILALVLLICRSLIRKKPVLDIDLNLFDFRHKLGHVYFDYSQRSITFSADNNDDSYLTVTFPQQLQSAPDLTCESKDSNSLCLKWMHRGKLEIKESLSQNARCYNIVWTPKNNGFVPLDCFPLTDAHWYGGSAHYTHDWPVEQLNVPLQPYISSPLLVAKETGKEVFGPVLERYWFSSKGVGIYVDNSVPLHVSINENNDNKMCFKASYISNHYQNPENLPPVLRYFVCKADNAKEIHEHMYKKCFKVPTRIPDEKRMQNPTWTSAKFRDQNKQLTVLTYTNEININKFPKGFFEVYGKYFRAYGDYNFDDKKFPNAHQMIGELKSSGFDVGTWVTPYMDLKSLHAETGKKNGYFVHDADSDVLPASISWNGNISLFVDFTNQQAFKWFHDILENIQKDYRNTAFTFDGGESSFFDQSQSMKNFIHNPCEYSTKYVELAASLGDKGTVKVGYQSQQYAMFVEIPDRRSSWDYKGGLKSIIPTVLTYGLLGYPFINPGPIGGRGSFSQKSFKNETFESKILPESELYVRWMLLSTYLPIMQFSYAPWEYNNETTLLALQLVQYHRDRVFPLLKAAAKEAEVTGMPIIRPVWWVAPEDIVAQRVDCEFLVGDSLLVAPVLEKGDRERQVYLPSGSRWKDNLRQKHYDGGQWLENYRVELTEIATFEREKTPV
ncbi:myogenesis-regulating glycosidase-like [Haliotis asinina]|uniref:myogenesis-regulating glycosidase-like n=1 Tax=Haliotis asinina TaxID=109174 RepID=UPI0035323DE8